MKELSQYCAFLLLTIGISFCCSQLVWAQGNTIPAESDSQPKESLLQSGGSVVGEVGQTLSNYGENRGGLIGKGSRIAGRIYTSIGSTLTGSDSSNLSISETNRTVGRNAKEIYYDEMSKDNNRSGGSTTTVNKNATNTTREQSGYAASAGATISGNQSLKSYSDALQSSNFDVVRQAAKEIYKSKVVYDIKVTDIAEKVLMANHTYDGDRVYFDALAWICKVLGASGNPKYIDTLNKAAQNSAYWKLRMYAIENRDKLAKIQPLIAEANSSENIEDRLLTLINLHQKGLISEAEYKERRKEIIESI